jgi:hypothetical protein
MELSLNRSSLACLAIAGLLTACNGDTDANPTDTDADTDAGEPTCSSGIASTFPDADAAGVFYRSAIEIVFNSDESTTSTLELATADGAVEGTTTYSEDGVTATFAPAADLTSSTQYTLTVSYSCDKVAEIGFSTSETGAAVDGASVVDTVYNVDIASGRITEPAGVGDLLMPLIAQQGFNLLIAPSAYDDAAMELSFLGALGIDEGGAIVQDVCNESITFPIAGDYSDNPFVSVAGQDVPLSISGFEISLAEIELTGAFSPDGSSLDGLSLGGFADTGPLGPALDLGDGEDAVCALVTTFGVSCVDCGDGSMTCLEIQFEDITADMQMGMLEEITLDDIANNADCAE